MLFKFNGTNEDIHLCFKTLFYCSGGADAGIMFLADDGAELASALGLTMSTGCLVRSKRYSLIADDGVVTHYFSSSEQASDTWAPNVLSSL